MGLAALDLSGTTEVVIFVAVLAVVYFAPTLLALVRRTGHLPSIIGMNLLAGWTGVGWWVALAMSMSAAHARAHSYNGHH